MAVPRVVEGDLLEPGLEGYSSGSDSSYRDDPEPQLPTRAIWKKVLRSASGPRLRRPGFRDEVLVRAEVRLSAAAEAIWSTGTSPLKFQLGANSFGATLDSVIPTMRGGEEASFALTEHWIFAGPWQTAIGKSVEKVFLVVELLQWLPVSILSEDGTIVKRVLRRALDRRKTAAGSLVSVALREGPDRDWEIRLHQLPEAGATREEGPPPPEINIGAPKPPLSMALLGELLLSMRPGERARVEVSGTSSEACDIELLDFIEDANASFERAPLLPAATEVPQGALRLRKWSWHRRDAYKKCRFEGVVQLRHLRVAHDEIPQLQRDFYKKVIGDEQCQDSGPSIFPATAREAVSNRFRLGFGDVEDVWEAVAASMSVGEVAHFAVDAKGAAEPPTQTNISATTQPQNKVGGLPAECHNDAETSAAAAQHILAWVEAFEPSSSEATKKSDEEKLHKLNERKALAVDLLKRQRNALAAYHFREVYEALGYIDDYRGATASEEKKRRVQELKVACLSNRALALLRLGNFEGTIEACDYALDLDPNNPKLLYRRARARLARGGREESWKDARKALEMMPKDEEILKLLKEITLRMKEDAATTKPLYSKMCGALGHLPHPLDVD